MVLYINSIEMELARGHSFLKYESIPFEKFTLEKCTYIYQRKYSISSEKYEGQTSNKSLDFQKVQRLGMRITLKKLNQMIAHQYWLLIKGG